MKRITKLPAFFPVTGDEKYTAGMALSADDIDKYRLTGKPLCLIFKNKTYLCIQKTRCRKQKRIVRYVFRLSKILPKHRVLLLTR
jgi:hypothetical protein